MAIERQSSTESSFTHVVQPERALAFVGAAIETGSPFRLDTDPYTLNTEVTVRVARENRDEYFDKANRVPSRHEEDRTEPARRYSFILDRERLPYHLLAATSLNLDYRVVHLLGPNEASLIFSISKITPSQREQFKYNTNLIEAAEVLLNERRRSGRR